MDLLPHALTQGGVDQLVALDPVAAGERARYDQRLEVLPVAADLDVLAGEAGFDAAFDALRGDQWRSPF